MRYFFLSLFLCVYLSACRSDISKLSDYAAWLNNTKHGLRKEHCFNEVCISAKYLPANYRALQQSKNDEVLFDSLLTTQKNSVSFLMVFSPDHKTGKKQDIIYKDIEGIEHYKQRMLDLNFNMSERVQLYADSNIYKPVLASFENTYSATDFRSLILLFAPLDSTDTELFTADTLDLELYDDIFNTGITHYTFSRSSINKTPTIIYE